MAFCCSMPITNSCPPDGVRKKPSSELSKLIRLTGCVHCIQCSQRYKFPNDFALDIRLETVGRRIDSACNFFETRTGILVPSGITHPKTMPATFAGGRVSLRTTYEISITDVHPT